MGLLNEWNDVYKAGGFGGLYNKYAPSREAVRGYMGDAIDNPVSARKAFFENTIGVDVTDPKTADMPLSELGLLAVFGGTVGKAKKTKTLAAAAAKEVAKLRKIRKKKVKTSADLANLREMSVADAVKEAAKEPHLIPSADSAEGKYIGGPRNVKTKQQLNKMRVALDDGIDKGAPGGDWYDRFRGGVSDVTGGNQNDGKWMSNLEGMMSAGVAPSMEIGSAIKETNGLISGFPVKAARPAQHMALINAVRQNDPDKMQLGKKTGEYARKVNPNQVGPATATGVNDFRHARNIGYTEPDGSPQREGFSGDAPHRFMDYETALAVKRANERKLSGRSDWNGEQIQATAWVKQKGDDLYKRGEKNYRKKAIALMQRQGKNDLSDEKVEEVARDLAFQEANKTITDFFPKHTAYGTYETMPGPGTGHLPGSVSASQAQRDAIGADPRGSFATAPGGRDSIYSGLRAGDTGLAMRVQPTAKMQGIYEGQGGLLELNPGEVAQPLVGFQTNGAAPKTLPQGDRAILQAGEGLRAAISGQDAGAAHIVTDSGRVRDRNAVRSGLLSKLSPQEAIKMRDIGSKYGYGDTVDTGDGVTMTNFGGDASTPTTKDMKTMTQEIMAVRADMTTATRSSVDGIYAGLTDAWKAGEGSGAVSKQILEWIEATPELAKAMDNNPYIAKNALNYIERDKGLEKLFGPGRKDLQTLREIVGAGPGWVGRLKTAIAAGTVPALAAITLAAGAQESGQEPSP